MTATATSTASGENERGHERQTRPRTTDQQGQPYMCTCTCMCKPCTQRTCIYICTIISAREPASQRVGRRAPVSGKRVRDARYTYRPRSGQKSREPLVRFHFANEKAQTPGGTRAARFRCLASRGFWLWRSGSWLFHDDDERPRCRHHHQRHRR